LRAAVTTDGVQSSLLYRETEKDSFRTVVTTDFKNALEPLFFSFDNQRLYVSSNIGRDKTAIYLYDLKDAKFLDLVYENPEVDVSGRLRSKAREVITGVAFRGQPPRRPLGARCLGLRPRDSVPGQPGGGGFADQLPRLDRLR
jgi:hypothetical protein